MVEMFEVDLTTKLNVLMRNQHHHLFHLDSLRRRSSEEN